MARIRLRGRATIRPAVLNIRTLEIDRSRWLTGEWVGEEAGLHDESRLLHPRSHMMCCLGFCLRKLRVRPEEMAGMSVPSGVASLIPLPHREWLASNDGVEDLTLINDSSSISRADREARIIALFQQHNIVVTFVGRYPTRKQVEHRLREERKRLI